MNSFALNILKKLKGIQKDKESPKNAKSTNNKRRSNNISKSKVNTDPSNNITNSGKQDSQIKDELGINSDLLEEYLDISDFEDETFEPEIQNGIKSFNSEPLKIEENSEYENPENKEKFRKWNEEKNLTLNIPDSINNDPKFNNQTHYNKPIKPRKSKVAPNRTKEEGAHKFLSLTKFREEQFARRKSINILPKNNTSPHKKRSSIIQEDLIRFMSDFNQIGTIGDESDGYIMKAREHTPKSARLANQSFAAPRATWINQYPIQDAVNMNSEGTPKSARSTSISPSKTRFSREDIVSPRKILSQIQEDTNEFKSRNLKSRSSRNAINSSRDSSRLQKSQSPNSIHSSRSNRLSKSVPKIGRGEEIKERDSSNVSYQSNSSIKKEIATSQQRDLLLVQAYSPKQTPSRPRSHKKLSKSVQKQNSKYLSSDIENGNMTLDPIKIKPLSPSLNPKSTPISDNLGTEINKEDYSIQHHSFKLKRPLKVEYNTQKIRIKSARIVERHKAIHQMNTPSTLKRPSSRPRSQSQKKRFLRSRTEDSLNASGAGRHNFRSLFQSSFDLTSPSPVPWLQLEDLDYDSKEYIFNNFLYHLFSYLGVQDEKGNKGVQNLYFLYNIDFWKCYIAFLIEGKEIGRQEAIYLENHQNNENIFNSEPELPQLKTNISISSPRLQNVDDFIDDHVNRLRTEIIKIDVQIYDSLSKFLERYRSQKETLDTNGISNLFEDMVISKIESLSRN